MGMFYGNKTIAQHIEETGAKAIAGADNQIYINYESFLDDGWLQNAADFLHELIHLQTGLGNGEIQERLGLDVSSSSANISEKLLKACIR